MYVVIRNLTLLDRLLTKTLKLYKLIFGGQLTLTLHSLFIIKVTLRYRKPEHSQRYSTALIGLPRRSTSLLPLVWVFSTARDRGASPGRGRVSCA